MKSAVEAFETYDRDKSDVITRKDFQTALRTMRVDLDFEDSRNLLKAVDPANTNDVKYRAFVRFVMGNEDDAAARDRGDRGDRDVAPSVSVSGSGSGSKKEKGLSSALTRKIKSGLETGVWLGCVCDECDECDVHGLVMV